MESLGVIMSNMREMFNKLYIYIYIVSLCVASSRQYIRINTKRLGSPEHFHSSYVIMFDMLAKATRFWYKATSREETTEKRGIASPFLFMNYY